MTTSLTNSGTERFIVTKIRRRSALGLLAAAVAAPTFGSVSKKPSQTPKQRNPKDPDFNNPQYIWDLKLSDKELNTLSALCSVVIPADKSSPSAGEIGVHHFINEYVSAPYSENESTLHVIRAGLVELTSKSQTQHNKDFVELSLHEQIAIYESLSSLSGGKEDNTLLERFFHKVATLTASGYFTTQVGMNYIGYVGNKPSTEFSGPPKEIIEILKL